MRLRSLPDGRPLPLGAALLREPLLNKGTAFTREEREALCLNGLLPPRVSTIDEQVERVLVNYRSRPSPLDKYIHLVGLQDRNETLFYRVLIDNLEELMPVIYTPTVGEACQKYGQIFRRPRGLYVSREDRGHLRQVLRNWPHRDVRVIVVTDGERILGLGDLGANGMGIPVGKLALYTACAGIPPDWCLPVQLDVGTNNGTLREDRHYLGLREPRLRGPEYDALVDELVSAVQEIFPRALLQLEDFGTANAFGLLERYRRSVRTFDDDIQGTAAVALAGLESALKLTGRKLTDQKLLFLGAGQAGTGIADLFVSALVQAGMRLDDARARCWFHDPNGLVVKARKDLLPHNLRYAHDAPFVPDLLESVNTVRPTALLGVAGAGRIFTRPIVEAMSMINERPIIFPLSNPTSKAECTAEEAYTWSNGRAVYASGSPFGPVTFNGRRYSPGQGNNSYIFPGVGLGIVASGARTVDDEMFLAAAHTLAALATPGDLEQGRIFPSLSRIREVSVAIATVVATYAWERGLATEPRPRDITETIRRQLYVPEYPRFLE